MWRSFRSIAGIRTKLTISRGSISCSVVPAREAASETLAWSGAVSGRLSQHVNVSANLGYILNSNPKSEAMGDAVLLDRAR